MWTNFISDKVRIISFGVGMDGGLEVQTKDNAEQWITIRRFYQSDDYMHHNAREFAQSLNKD